METQFSEDGWVGIFRSYPTYEEWKHMKAVLPIPGLAGSYPTYEEWKLSILTLTNLAKGLCSYPRYEK